MGPQQCSSPGQQPAGALVSVRIVSDPAGKTETPGRATLCVAIHLGRSVYMRCERGGQRHQGLLVHGDIDIVPPRMPCIWEPQERDTALVVALEPRLISEVAEQSGLDSSRAAILNRFQIRDPQIENIGWAFKAEMEAGYPGGRLFSESLATALASCLLRRHSTGAHFPAPRNGGLAGKRLKQVLAYVEDNLAEDLSLADIAAVAGVSSSHFKAMFRRSMGLPVHRYVLRRRVDRAKELLATSRLSVADIAAQTGFAHQSHLALHMRRILGCSPSAIRKGDQGAAPGAPVPSALQSL